jgi:hypothetical protein
MSDSTPKPRDAARVNFSENFQDYYDNVVNFSPGDSWEGEVVVPSHCDSVLYRRMKEYAAKTGRKLRVAPPAPVPDRVVVAGSIVCPRDASPGTYRALKAEGKAKGLPFHIEG